jgi:triosephosphate isomerase
VNGGLTAIYCVGETLEEREAERTHDVVEGQLAEAISRDVPADRLVIAYEPVWAIGTGKTATPEQAQEVHRLIRDQLGSIYDATVADRIRILYGGSVKPGNAGALAGEPDIDGALVGGACLVASDFLAIISAAASVSAGAR